MHQKLCSTDWSAGRPGSVRPRRWRLECVRSNISVCVVTPTLPHFALWYAGNVASVSEEPVSRVGLNASFFKKQPEHRQADKVAQMLSFRYPSLCAPGVLFARDPVRLTPSVHGNSDCFISTFLPRLAFLLRHRSLFATCPVGEVHVLHDHHHLLSLDFRRCADDGKFVLQLGLQLTHVLPSLLVSTGSFLFVPGRGLLGLILVPLSSSSSSLPLSLALCMMPCNMFASLPR